ncbi:threonylcarbamoyl-AMP synthase, putative [Plasmodium knowlesi strain H]|uniref:Threonylcarbamoyl-AMP synthase n=3 Tax=Plasmodium knowlesi TaxID=5850 RepID=A0A5K1VBH9_PLAKH|nr:threonylcarbamoyl-AMP synthase, putative [Plasmodium knowlesi strain H]OTN66873.1 putative DsRNA binding protein [Plasmodium knowlesi]CAA9990073.1 threonylcarbamoyl-AMP synthase, putative [Plasmodium knowlesi strain H]SBO25736.1 threonylcarbamoyl-AMP synthase, putative [Plasmodium knowlesi strain H]SBO28545.1 threonylcarbamoyl-AMP synthase, putative [Plasmodium knowlesi strain H]VVS79547.1 threonylcarbamoyl-AMP synthase, putative [Plasmodium knowlesi strain H]|eukprot:XP_002260540.1 dsRNA binding protein, putative [Plasmodium knowlesi strain H]
MAEIFKGSDLLENEQLRKRLKAHIEADCLVGMPTETVYGLGGNSLSEKSLRNIFEMKNRPVSDPIISHVYDIKQAFDQLYHVNVFEMFTIYTLSKYFWPGPLSIIAKAKKELPLILTAHTGFCAVRMPRNNIAIEIIKVSQVPIAAPSANKFQHISPTTSAHVFQEFEKEKIIIFDDGQCDIGIESTVLKLVKFKKTGDRKPNRLSGAGETCEAIQEEEVTTDDEYEKECTDEMEFLREVTGIPASETNVEVYDRLKDLFETIGWGNKVEDMSKMGGELSRTSEYPLLEKVLKYKNLYDYRIRIYRRGKYTKEQIEEAVSSSPLLKDIQVDLYEKIKFENVAILHMGKGGHLGREGGIQAEGTLDGSVNGSVKAALNSCLSNCLGGNTAEEEEVQNEVSPGLLLTHYSPVVSTYLLDGAADEGEQSELMRKNPIAKISLGRCVLLDIGDSFELHQGNFLKYINISYEGVDTKEEQTKLVMKNFFLFLRQAEELAIEYQAEGILISILNLKCVDERNLSIFDRIFRAASGRILHVAVPQVGSLRLL